MKLDNIQTYFDEHLKPAKSLSNKEIARTVVRAISFVMTCLLLAIKKGKLTISRRYNQLPLLLSSPGGFEGS
jgi:hypothetical protein